MKLKLYTKQRFFDAEIFDASNFNARVLTARLLPLDSDAESLWVIFNAEESINTEGAAQQFQTAKKWAYN